MIKNKAKKMRAILTILLICAVCCLQAQDVRLSLITTIDNSKSNYRNGSNNIGSSDNEELPIGAPFGYSITLQVEEDLNEKLAWYGGFGFKQKRFEDQRKKQALNFADGSSLNGTINPNPIRPWINPKPIKHNFYLLSIPIGLKLKPCTRDIIQPYFAIGLESDFQFIEKQTIEHGYTGFTNNPGVDNVFNADIEYSENKFDYYGTALTFGTGMEWAVSKSYNICLHSRVNVIEFRKTNNTIPFEDYNLWNSSFFMLGQLSFGLGLQKSF